MSLVGHLWGCGSGGGSGVEKQAGSWGEGGNREICYGGFLGDAVNRSVTPTMQMCGCGVQGSYVGSCVDNFVGNVAAVCFDLLEG